MTAQLKRCTKCGEEKPATAEFWQRDAGKRDGLSPHCKDCRCAWNRASYYRNHERNKAKMSAHKARRGLASQMIYEEFRSRGCMVCACQDNRIIQAHHMDPAAKDSNIRGRTGEFIPPAAMLAELAKCAPLCSNHHDLVHIMFRNGCASWPLGDIIAKLKCEHRAWVLEQAEDLRI